jgi:hypothetical protein
MAKLYYVKDGPLRESSGPGRDILLAVLENRLTGHDVTYLGQPLPVLNPAYPSRDPTHVVIEVEADEPVGQMFTRRGFYVLPQLTPAEAGGLIFPNP